MMLQTPALRLVVGLPAAALVVLGLYQFMTAMIGTEFDPPEEGSRGTIAPIPLPSKDEPVERGHVQPDKLELADQPPPPPAFAIGPAEIDISIPGFSGAVPLEIGAGPLDLFSVAPAPIPDRIVKPLTPPSIAYPRNLATKGIDGSCDVQMDVDVRGRPFNVEASCTHRGFAREAERAVRRVMFAPEIVDGQPRARRNVVYPIEFRLDES